MPIYQIVISVLSQPTQSNLDKSIAAAMMDGTISIEDLAIINGMSAFPGNHFNALKLPEGAYSSNEVMNAFTRAIGPFLSDRNLYQITHKLIAAEINKLEQTHSIILHWQNAFYFMKWNDMRQTRI